MQLLSLLQLKKPKSKAQIEGRYVMATWDVVEKEHVKKLVSDLTVVSNHYFKLL